MILTVIESPYAAQFSAYGNEASIRREVDQNRLYLKACLRDSIARGEAPFASHELYTRALDDACPIEREAGLRAGESWASRAERRVLYLDRGLSEGMVRGLKQAIRLKQKIYVRGLADWRGPMRLEALRKLNGHLDTVACDVDWAGF